MSFFPLYIHKLHGENSSAIPFKRQGVPVKLNSYICAVNVSMTVFTCITSRRFQKLQRIPLIDICFHTVQIKINKYILRKISFAFTFKPIKNIWILPLRNTRIIFYDAEYSTSIKRHLIRDYKCLIVNGTFLTGHDWQVMNINFHVFFSFPFSPSCNKYLSAWEIQSGFWMVSFWSSGELEYCAEIFPTSPLPAKPSYVPEIRFDESSYECLTCLCPVLCWTQWLWEATSALCWVATQACLRLCWSWY